MEEDTRKNSSASKIQRQFKVHMSRKRLLNAKMSLKERRQSAAVAIQSLYRGHVARKVTKYGLGYDKELVMALK